MLQLEPFTMNYSGVNAHALAHACMLVASPKWREDHKAAAEGWTLQWISTAAATDQRVLIASNDHAIVAVFHDNEDEPLDQWIRKEGPEKAAGPAGAGFGSPPPSADQAGAAGHEQTLALPSAGFGISSLNKRLDDRFQQVWPETLASLRAARRRSIFLTGHGLGGAYAVLAAVSLCARDDVLHGVYTFGQPRVLSRDLALWFNLDFGSHVFRFVNNNDLVTLCPFRRDGYGHAGTLVFFNAAGELHCDGYWWSRLLSEFDESAESELPKLLRVTPSGIRDHMIERYVELTLRHRDHGLRP